MADEITDLPSTSRLWPDERTGPWLLEFEWRLIATRAECVGLRIVLANAGDVGPVTTTLLRQLRLSEIVREERERLGEKLAGKFDLPEVQPPTPQMRPATVRRLRKAAAVYSKAWRAGQNPVQAVAKALNVTPAAATKLVYRARGAGFLPPASPGVPVG